MKLFCISFMCMLFLYEVHTEVDSEVDSAEPEEYVDEVSEEYSTIESELEVLTKDVLPLQPEFDSPISNVSVAVGENATFTCIVRELGAYRVAWKNFETHTILSIHTHPVTLDLRVSVAHSKSDKLDLYHLHIDSVTEEDRGGYECGINTKVMKTQIGYLDVTLPPPS